MEMWHFLVRILAMIGQHPVALFFSAKVSCNGAYRFEKASDLTIAGFFAEIGHGQVSSFGNHQNMDRCLRINVMKGDGEFVVIDFLARNFAAKDLGKNIVWIIGHGLGSNTEFCCALVNSLGRCQTPERLSQ